MDMVKNKTVKIHRSTIDNLVSTAGLFIAIGLVLAAGALFWAHDFIHSQVTEQLSAQRIFFPEANTPAIDSLNAEDRQAVSMYAGQQLTTGAQAEVFANHYIRAHLDGIAGGKTYGEVSNLSRANPEDVKLKAQVDQLFKGETLRGTLLNAYAFDTMAVIAKMIAIGALILSGVLLVLSILGYRHARTPSKK